MTKPERVTRAREFREVDRVPVQYIVDHGATISGRNAGELEYSAIRVVRDVPRMLCVPEFRLYRSITATGEWHLHMPGGKAPSDEILHHYIDQWSRFDKTHIVITI